MGAEQSSEQVIKTPPPLGSISDKTTSENLAKLYEVQEGGMFGKAFGVMDSITKVKETPEASNTQTSSEQVYYKVERLTPQAKGDAIMAKVNALDQAYMELSSLRPSGRNQVNSVNEGKRENLKQRYEILENGIRSLAIDLEVTPGEKKSIEAQKNRLESERQRVIQIYDEKFKKQ